MTLETRILDFLETESIGYDDDCLARKLGIKPRQTVNQICRKLESETLLQRTRTYCPVCNREKIVNYLQEPPSPTMATQPNFPVIESPSNHTYPKEEELKTKLLDMLRLKQDVKDLNKRMHQVSTLLALEYLRKNFPQVKDWTASSGTETGPDIVGLDGGNAIVAAEVKGTDPYHGDRLGANQISSIEWDIRKLQKFESTEKYLFLIGPRAVDAVRHQFRNAMADICTQDLLDPTLPEAAEKEES